LITIKLFGGAKKSFGKDQIQTEFDGITISKLLEYLLSVKPVNTLEFDTKNILIAVNGADSSALHGHNTILHSGDTVSIIPVIHGGARLQFKADSRNVELFNIKNKKGKNYDFMTELQKKFPDLTIEGISSKSIVSTTHAKKIIALSLYAQKNHLLLSKKFGADILLRFAATTQISAAIKAFGIEQQENFTIIAIGNKASLGKLHRYLEPYLIQINYSDNSKHLQKQFKITKKHLKVVDSKTPLEDLLAEKASVLFQ
jgi:molybdopterin converting factor small subunit/tRNA threonylcarbamoyladenosine modification (KEOPS) complex Cgi121 subunit